MTRLGPTEDTPITPSWVETRFDDILASLPSQTAQALRAERARYLDCLAGTSGPADPAITRPRCHADLLQRLHAAGLDPELTAELHRQLEALEAELDARS